MSLAEDKSVENFLIHCRNLGVRITPLRMAILKELSGTVNV